MMSIRWKKSSKSGQQYECVELAHTLDAVRDSKNPAGPALVVDLVALVATTRTGRFDR